MVIQGFIQLFTWKLQKSFNLPYGCKVSKKSHAPFWNARWKDGAEIQAGHRIATFLE